LGGEWVKFGDGNGFGLVTFGAELFVGIANRFAFAEARNGFIVCPVVGNRFVLGLVGKGLVPSKPFCDEKGLGTVGNGGGEFVRPNGESPVACMGKGISTKRICTSHL
jgi:hypothetical protein